MERTFFSEGCPPDVRNCSAVRSSADAGDELPLTGQLSVDCEGICWRLIAGPDSSWSAKVAVFLFSFHEMLEQVTTRRLVHK